MVTLSIKSGGNGLTANDLSQTINVSIPLVVNATVVESRVNMTGLVGSPSGTFLLLPPPPDMLCSSLLDAAKRHGQYLIVWIVWSCECGAVVVCVAWKDGDWTSTGCTRDPGYDAAGYTITECKCSFLASAYATAYEWDVANITTTSNTTTESSVDQSASASAVDSDNDPYMGTDQIVLLVIFVAVALVGVFIIIQRIRYNHKKQSLVGTTEAELVAWNLERGNDLAKVPRVLGWLVG